MTATAAPAEFATDTSFENLPARAIEHAGFVLASTIGRKK
jgi:hypothetical protein